MQLTHEHEELRRTYRRVIEEEINPHVNEWEAAQIFPAHQVFKKLGRLGLLGVTAIPEPDSNRSPSSTSPSTRTMPSLATSIRHRGRVTR
jgi:alkylation response protein AidB-like acyl-CoA dehydrogenase